MKWDESKHPRVPAGTSEGGEFTEKGQILIVKSARKAAGVPTPESFMEEVEAREDTMLNPLGADPIVFLTDDGQDVAAHVYLADYSHIFSEPAVYFNITVPEQSRGQGYGTDVMKKLMGMADESGIPLIGDVSAFGQGEKMTNKQLRSWYESLGFITGENADQIVYWPK